MESQRKSGIKRSEETAVEAVEKEGDESEKSIDRRSFIAGAGVLASVGLVGAVAGSTALASTVQEIPSGSGELPWLPPEPVINDADVCVRIPR